MSLLARWNWFLPPANEVWGKVICLQASVCPQGGSTSPGTPQEADIPPDQVHPPGADTPRKDTPWDQYNPREQTPPRTRYTPWSRHPGTRYTPLEQTPPRTRYTPWNRNPPSRPGTPPSTEHAGRYGQRVGGPHPTGMQSCFSILFLCIFQLLRALTLFKISLVTANLFQRSSSNSLQREYRATMGRALIGCCHWATANQSSPHRGPSVFCR